MPSLMHFTRQGRRVRSKMGLWLVVLLLAASCGQPLPGPGTAHGQTGERRELNGTLFYSERGPLAMYEGWAYAMLVGECMPLMVARTGLSIQRILEDLTLLTRIDPSFTGVSEFMGESFPADCSILPILTSYEATLTFKLQEGDEGVYRLASGTLVYSGENRTVLAQPGVMLSLIDNMTSSGSYTLDPAKDKIELKVDFSKERPTYTLEIEVEYPQHVEGNSVMNVAPLGEVARFERQGDTLSLVSALPYMPSGVISEQPMDKLVSYLVVGEFPQGGAAGASSGATVPAGFLPVSYSSRATAGPAPESAGASSCQADLRYCGVSQAGKTETFRDITGSQVVVKHSVQLKGCQLNWDAGKIDQEAERYRNALMENIRKRPSYQQQMAEWARMAGEYGGEFDPESMSVSCPLFSAACGSFQRLVRAQTRDLMNGVDGITDDCRRIAREVNQNCDDLIGCLDRDPIAQEAMCQTLSAGPATFCQEVHETVLSTLPGTRWGSDQITAAYDGFTRQVPCLRPFYSRGEFADLVGAISQANQPLAGLPPLSSPDSDLSLPPLQ